MGRIEIRADQLEQYFTALAEIEQQRAPFQRHLRGLQGDFTRSLARRYSKRTVRKHRYILGLFLDFICDETQIVSLEQVTKGMVNSGFRRWCRSKVGDQTTDNEIRATLRKFFQFLNRKKGIANVRALEALR